MKKKLCFVAMAIAVATNVRAQDLKAQNVPDVVKAELAKKYPEAAKVGWEKEKGNHEANWGGKSGGDNSVVFIPDGVFVEIVKAIKISDIPAIAPYVSTHYKGAKIKEAGKVPMQPVRPCMRRKLKEAT